MFESQPAWMCCRSSLCLFPLLLYKDTAGTIYSLQGVKMSPNNCQIWCMGIQNKSLSIIYFPSKGDVSWLYSCFLDFLPRFVSQISVMDYKCRSMASKWIIMRIMSAYNSLCLDEFSLIHYRLMTFLIFFLPVLKRKIIFWCYPCLRISCEIVSSTSDCVEP